MAVHNNNPQLRHCYRISGRSIHAPCVCVHRLESHSALSVFIRCNLSPLVRHGVAALPILARSPFPPPHRHGYGRALDVAAGQGRSKGGRDGQRDASAAKHDQHGGERTRVHHRLCDRAARAESEAAGGEQRRAHQVQGTARYGG